MKSYATLFLLIFIAFQLQCQLAQGAYQLEYTIEVYADGSAMWFIEQKGIGIQPSFETFCQKVDLILEKAMVKTSRNMAAKGLSMMANLSGSYSVIRYMFLWENFSVVVENSCIKVGDIFEVENFFDNLYGDGSVYIKYPQQYVVESVSPTPHEQDNSSRILKWYGIEDFKIGEPKIVLKEKSAASGFLDIISKNAILIVSILVICGGSIGLYYLKFRRKKEKAPEVLEAPKPLGIEDDEEKIINLLRSAGGSLYQSAITEQCGFSRSKTSKLLKAMEDKGKIKREEKGREKIVTLLEEVKGESLE